MNQFEQLDQLIEKHDGTIQIFQVLEAGISKPTFYAYVKEKELEQAAHGVYVSPDAWIDANKSRHGAVITAALFLTRRVVLSHGDHTPYIIND